MISQSGNRSPGLATFPKSSKELKKKICNPHEKSFKLVHLSDYAGHVAATKSGTAVLHLRVKDAFFGGASTYTVSTRAAKQSTAQASQLEAIQWLENSITGMLADDQVYSPEVLEAMAELLQLIKAKGQVELSDQRVRALLKTLTEAKSLAPEKQCQEKKAPSVPSPSLQTIQTIDASDVPPPIVTTKQLSDRERLQGELSSSLGRLYKDMDAHGETERCLLDSQGQQVAVLRIRKRQAGLWICLDEATRPDFCPQGNGPVMGVTSEKVSINGAPLASLDETVAVTKTSRWLALAKRFESQVVPVAPLAMDRRSVLKERVPVVKNAMADLYQAMLAKGCQHIWTDRAYQVWATPVEPKNFRFAATITSAPDGKPVLTIDTYEAYMENGLKHACGSALMWKNPSDNSYTVDSFRLNRKDLNGDSDFEEIENLDAALKNMEDVLSLAKSFRGGVSRLTAAST